MKDKTITLPIGKFCIIDLVDAELVANKPVKWGGGNISTSWHTDIMDEEEVEYNAAIDGIEALVLAHAIAGINVESPAYIEGIETAIDGASNNT